MMKSAQLSYDSVAVMRWLLEGDGDVYEYISGVTAGDGYYEFIVNDLGPIHGYYYLALIERGVAPAEAAATVAASSGTSTSPKTGQADGPVWLALVVLASLAGVAMMKTFRAQSVK